MKNDFKLIISLLQNTRFKITVIIIALIFFMALGTITNNMTMVDGIESTLTWNFFIMVLLFLFIFNAYNIFTSLTKNYNFIVRMKDYKEFYFKTIKYISVSNLILYIIVMLLILIASILKTGMNTGTSMLDTYNVSNAIYMIFHIIRSFLILNTHVILLVSLYKFLKEEVIAMISGLIPLSIVALSPFMSDKEITHVFELPLYYGEYFINNNYGTILFEICMSILYISILMLICRVLIELTTKSSKRIEF